MRILLTALSLIIITAISYSGHNDILISTGDSLYQANDYQGSIDMFKQALAQDSLSAELHWRLARSLNILAELQPREKQQVLYIEAETAARKCIQSNSLIAEGHFQLARALGRIALFKGIFKSVSLAKESKKEAEKAILLDPRHDGAFHLLGRWHREVAQKPKFIRSPLGLGEAEKEKGLQNLARAIELNPNYINHRLEYGISLYDLGYKEEAKNQFETCISLTPTRPLDYKYQNEAKEYLARLNQKD